MTCVIVDDEPLARLRMKTLIEGIDQLNLLGSFDSSEAALEFLSSHTPDLIFLDIGMPGMDGLTLAKSLPPAIKIIFVTSPQVAITDDYFFVRSDRKMVRIEWSELLFIEGLKDYVILHTESQKVYTAMNIKTIVDQLPPGHFFRVSKSFVVNVRKIASVDNNSVTIGKTQIPIGSAYRNAFFDTCISSRLLGRR